MIVRAIRVRSAGHVHGGGGGAGGRANALQACPRPLAVVISCRLGEASVVGAAFVPAGLCLNRLVSWGAFWPLLLGAVCQGQ